MGEPRGDAVAAHGLRVRFGELVALDGLEVSAPAGAITAILGPNGAGKTTFVRAVATLQPVHGGSLAVAGIDVAAHPGQVRERIGLAGQQAALVDQLTGRENLQLVARLSGRRPREARASAARAVDALGLAPFIDRRVSSYSGGERRRVDLAASLVHEPLVLVLDEPTTGVDPRSRAELWKLVRDLPARGVSVLLTTQHLEEAAALADHVVIIDQGRCVAAGAPAQLRQAAGNASLRVEAEDHISRGAAVTLASALEAELEHGGNVISVVGTFGFEDAAAAIGASGITPSEVSFRPPTLEEVFLSLTDPQERAA